MKAALTQNTIEHLCSIFARLVYQKSWLQIMVLASPVVTTKFARRNQIRRLRTAPYLHSSNGLAESAV